MYKRQHHAIALHTANGTELILHVGLDTVKLKGQYLEVFVDEGQKIQKGDLILRADLEGLSLIHIYTYPDGPHNDQLYSPVSEHSLLLSHHISAEAPWQ